MIRLRPLAVFAGILIALCLLGLWGARSQSNGLRRVTTTTNEGININPSLSGDGRRIAFESTEDVAQAGGSDRFRAIRADITNEPPAFTQMAAARGPAPGISQDGTRIAFAAKEDPLGTNADGNSEIFLFDGNTLRQVTNTTPNDVSTRNRDGNFQPSLTDDGRFIAFSSNRNLAGQNGDGNLEIIVLDTASSSFAQLTNTTGAVGASDAKISGDGTRIAYIRDVNALPAVQRDLILQDRVGGTTRVLASNVLNLALTYGRAISDDGLRVVYSADIATDSSQVFLFEGRTSNSTRQITTLGIRTTEVPLHPTISGDGTRLAFATRRPIAAAGSNSDNSIELYTYDVPTGQFARVTNATSEADGFNGTTRVTEVVSSLNDDGSVVAFNFPRSLSGAVTSGLENNSEIYVTGTAPRPTVGSLTVVNGASHGNEPSTTEAVAPDSYAAALGGALASTTEQAQKQPNGTFPTTVGGTTVTVNGRAAQIFYVSPTLVYFLVPPQTELGTATVVVTNSEGFRSQGTVTVLRAAPGIFTTSGDGTGEGVVLNAQTEQPGPFDPSDGNLRLLIFSTGVRNALVVTATAAGRALTVESIIASADMPGFDEIRVRVPADLRGTGTVNLVVRADGRDSNPVTIVFSGSPRNDLIINEVLADPPDGIAGDANQDGVRDSSDDEFVEIVNNAGDIDISGYQLLTRSNTASTDTVRFTFPAGTFVPAGSAIVVFGGGNPNPNNPSFGGAQIFTTTGGLSLTNSGGVVTLRDASQSIVNIFSYGGSTGLNGDGNQSLTRSPDITGGFVQHGLAPNAGGRVYSPGTRVDGSPFASGAGRLTSITISPPSANVTVGQSTQFTAQARDQFNRAMTSPTITFASDATNIATVDSVTKDPGTGIATATVTGRGEGTAHITATATNGGITITSSQSTITVFPPPPVANRVEVTPSSATINRGNTQQFSATAFQPNNQPVPNAIFTWSSSNTNIATIDGNGLATGVGIGTVTITASTSDGSGGTISGTASLTVQVPLVINEILADPPTTISGDSNRDGVVNSDDDEFVELVNNSAASVDISGVILADSTNNRFTFPANTILAAGQGVVIFGGGTPPANEPAFGGSLIFTTGSLGLANGGDSVTVKLPVSGNDVVISTQAYGAEGGDDQSLTRSPDLTGAFVKHTTATNADGRIFSPGTRVDGTPFGSPAVTRIEVTPPSASVAIGGTQLFTARAFSNVGGPEIEILNVSFIWDSTDATKATVAPTTGRTTTATGLAAGTTTIRARAGGQLGSSSLTVNPPPPTLTINDVSLNEGNGGPTTFTFTVSLSAAAPAGGVTFDIATADVTAQDGTPGGEDNDYVARSLTGQTIAAGLTTYSFDVTVNGDVNIEPSETFVVNVTNVSGATLGDGQGQGTIQNDDSASLSITDVSLTEGDSGTKTFTFTVSSTIAAPVGGITFDIATADGTAQDDTPASEDNDYVARSLTSQTIPFGQQTYTFDVTVNGDTAVEANETFFVNITNVSGAVVNDGQGQGTIQNDDTALVVISQLYGGGGNGGATYTHDFIELFNRGTTPVDLTGWSVQYTSSAGTSWQVTNLSGTLQPGQYYLVQEASNALVGSPLPTPDATGSIVMAAGAGKVALVSTTSALSGSCPSGATIIDFVGYGSGANCFEGAGPAPTPSATASDHRANNGCTDNNNNAADFSVAAPTPRNTSTPINNCSFPSLSINDVSVSEGNSGTVTASFTVSLSAPAPAGGVTFNIQTQDATATVGDNDYVARNLTSQTIAQGNQTYTFDVTVNGDVNIEPTETFLVNVTSISGANATDTQGLGTIQNDDSPPDLTINDVTANETNAGTTTFTFTVSLSSIAQAGGVTFDIATQDDSAVAGSDFVGRSLTSQTIPAGQQTYTFDVTVNGDTIFEGNESFFVNVTNVTGTVTVIDSQGVGTITNDDAQPTISIADTSVTEGNAGTSLMTFTVTLSNASQATVSVNYDTADSSATVGNNDYVSASGTLNFVGGDTSETFTVTINGDTNAEGDEVFFANLTVPSGATISDSQGLGTIFLDDAFSIAALNTAYTENFDTLAQTTSSTTPAAWTRAESGTAANTTYSAGTGSSTTGDTYSFGIAGVNPITDRALGGLQTGSLVPTIGAFYRNDTGSTINTLQINYTGEEWRLGATSRTDQLDFQYSTNATSLTTGTWTDVNALDFITPNTTTVGLKDGNDPANRTAISNTITGLSIAPGATFLIRWTDFNVTGTDDGLSVDDFSITAGITAPSLSINDVPQAETNAGTTTFTFTVSLSSPAPAGGVSFTVNTADGTTNPATAGSDYVAIVGGSGSIAQNDTSTTVSVTVNGDVTVEPDETFFVNISGVTGATLGDGQGLGTIQNDDSPPDLTINDVTANETNAGTTTFTFTVSLSSIAQAGGVTFDIATQDDSAVAGSDFVGRSLTSQTIPAGQQTYTFDVTVNGDTIFEGNESFFVNVTNVTGTVTVIDSQGVGTITNDDAQPTISIADTSVTEGNAGTSLMTFTVTLSNASQATVSVNYDTADSSATVGNNDYVSASGTLNFVGGDTSETFTVTINGDTNAEGDEVFFANLTVPSGATISDSQGLGTIFLDDAFSIAALNTAYTENFDTLAQTTSSTTPAAWTRAESGTAANTTYSAGTGSSTTGDTYSFGIAGVNPITDRALGGLRTGSLVPTVGAFYRNDTASTINTLQIDYTGEEWRLGTASRTDQLDFQYSTNATSLTTGTWTDVNALDFITPNTSTTGAKDGNSATNRTAISSQITGLSIAPGATFWIRWNDVEASGADDGLAVDDFSLTAGITTPSLSINDVPQAETNAGTTTFNFTVSLSSPAPAGGVSFTVNTADGTTNPATAGTDYVAIVNGSGSIAQNGTSTTVSVTVNGDTDIEPNETFFVNISGITGATSGDIQGLGTITNDDSVVASADLSITKSDSPDPLLPASTVTYKLDVTNLGPDTATSVTVTDNLPGSVTFGSCASTGGGVCSNTGNNVSVSFSSLANSATAQITLTATVNSGTGGTTITNTATIASSTSDPQSNNDSATTTTNVARTPNLDELIINEVLADPNTDANRDGSVAGDQRDEFVEIINSTSVALNLSGLNLYDSTTTIRHTFPANTLLQPGKAIVIFGGETGTAALSNIPGIPAGTSAKTTTATNASFGGSIVQVASSFTFGNTTSALGLNNTGSPADSVRIFNGTSTTGTILASATFPASTSDKSFSRTDVEIGPNRNFTAADLHPQVTNGASVYNGRFYSPGFKRDGVTSF